MEFFNSKKISFMFHQDDHTFHEDDQSQKFWINKNYVFFYLVNFLINENGTP